MKFAIPEISWHNRDPVLSVDFQTKSEPNDPLRLATGGTDSHVLIWYISTTETGSVSLEVAADLTRHQKAVNVVRWSPNGKYLASGDDESIIFVWKQKMEEPAPSMDGEEQYKESWVIYKTLRGHMEDILDLSWNRQSTQLASGSVDNKLLVWDVERGRYNSIVMDHKGFVQGVAWDPQGQLIASVSTDRVFRTFEVSTKKVVSRSSKAVLPFPRDHMLHGTSVRLYHDDTLQTYYRRLHFSPDGLLIAVPAGRIEADQAKLDMKPINAVYIYTRYSLKVPACVLPCGEPALVARWSPRRYRARGAGPAAALPLAHRLVLAVATRRALLLYDTQQRTPLALISNIHYTRLTDLTWSPDGLTLVASSTDGFCSVVTFGDGELGDVLPDDPAEPQEPMEVAEDLNEKEKEPEEPKAEEAKPIEVKRNKIDSFIKFKSPREKSPTTTKTDKEAKTPVKLDVLVETAMQSWSDNSSHEIINPQKMDVEVTVIEDSEDFKLVYDDTVSKQMAKEKSPNTTNDIDTKTVAPKQDSLLKKSKNVKDKKDEKTVSPKQSSFLTQAKVTDVKEPVKPTASIASPKAPRRVSFVTLSSPKNSKKK